MRSSYQLSLPPAEGRAAGLSWLEASRLHEEGTGGWKPQAVDSRDGCPPPFARCSVVVPARAKSQPIRLNPTGSHCKKTATPSLTVEPLTSGAFPSTSPYQPSTILACLERMPPTATFGFACMKTFPLLAVLAVLAGSLAVAQEPLTYSGMEGPGKGRKVVFIASDHEYKSEETLPALARVLAKHFGFNCTVLFGLDKATGNVKPGESNIPGTGALKEADLMVIFTRFQDLPAEQMQPIVDYLKRGGPVVGLRTATHGFKIAKDSPFAKFDYHYAGEEYKNGFGRQILGETWVGHYGPNHKSSTRIDLVADKAGHPVLSGVSHAWAQEGAYNAYPIEGSEILAMAQPLNGMEPGSPDDTTKKPMPAAWVRTYKSESGKEGRVFASTYGSSGAFENEGFRRMLVNACMWAVGLEKAIKPDMDVSLVGPFHPTWHGGVKRAAFKPQDLAGWDSPIPPPASSK